MPSCMCGPFGWCVQRRLGSYGISTIKSQKKREIRTLDHLGGRYGILSMLQVTGCVVEHEQALGKAILGLKDFDRAVDLGNEFLRVKVSVAVLAWFEHNSGLSVR